MKLRLSAAIAAMLVFGSVSLAAAQSRQFSLRINDVSLQNRYGACTNKTGLQGNAQYTIEAWVKPTSFVNFPTIVSNSFAHSYWLGLDTSGHVRFYPIDSAHGFFTSVSVVPQNQWTHVAVTYTSGDARIYVNGQLDTQVATFTGTAPSDTAALCVGADRGDAGTNFYFRGSIDEVQIWASVRTASQIYQEMSLSPGDPGYFPSGAYHNLHAFWNFENSGISAAFDFGRESGDSNFLTYINGDFNTSVPKILANEGAPIAINAAYTFNGTNDHLDTGFDVSAAGGYSAGLTIEAWLLSQGSADFQCIAGRAFTTSFWLGLTPDQHLRFYPTGGSQFVDSDITIPLNQWHAVAATYGDGVTNLFLDGAPITFHGPTITGAVGENGLTPWIGADHLGAGAYFFHGQLDNVRITPGRLSMHDIAAERFMSYETYAGAFHTDIHGVFHSAYEMSGSWANPGLAGSGTRLVRSGAVTANIYPGETPAVDDIIRASDSFALMSFSPNAGAQNEPPGFLAQTLGVNVPYDVPVHQPMVMVIASVADLNQCTLKLWSPSGPSQQVATILAPGVAHGRDLYTVIADNVTLPTLAAGVPPYLDGLRSSNSLAAFEGLSSKGLWLLQAFGTSGTPVEIVSWGLRFANSPAGVGDGPAQAHAALVLRSSMPARDGADFEITMPHAGHAQLRVYDVNGRAIACVYEGHSPAGTTLLHWNAGTQAAGAYFARLSIDGANIASRKLVLVH